MGCRPYFVADRLEALVDEGDSRSSSPVREHGSFRIVSQLHVAIQTPWSRCLYLHVVWTNRIVHIQRVARFWLDLRLRSRLRLCLYLNVQTHWYFRSQVRNVCRFPEHSNGTFVLSWQVALFCELDLGLVGLVGSFLIVEHLWTQFLHPIISQGNLRKRPRWLIYFLVYDFSSFHLDSFRDTIGCECIVKDDGVRSLLMWLKSFLLSKSDVDPIHRVLMFLPCCMHVPCKTRCFQVDRLRIFVFFVQRIYRQKVYCMPFAQSLASRYQSWIHDGMYNDCTSDVINVLEEIVQN